MSKLQDGPQSELVQITNAMVYAFNSALGDNSLSAAEVEDIKCGLRAAFAWIGRAELQRPGHYKDQLIEELDQQGTLAATIHYPDCWDTAVYPTLYDALYEMCASSHCSDERHVKEHTLLAPNDHGRHYDRTCPACQGEPQEEEPVAHDSKDEPGGKEVKLNPNNDIYVVMVKDRHTDPKAHVFRTYPAAERFAVHYLEGCADTAIEIEDTPSGWLFYATYGTEGDCIWILRQEIEGEEK